MGAQEESDHPVMPHNETNQPQRTPSHTNTPTGAQSSHSLSDTSESRRTEYKKMTSQDQIGESQVNDRGPTFPKIEAEGANPGNHRCTGRQGASGSQPSQAECLACPIEDCGAEGESMEVPDEPEEDTDKLCDQAIEDAVDLERARIEALKAKIEDTAGKAQKAPQDTQER